MCPTLYFQNPEETIEGTEVNEENNVEQDNVDIEEINEEQENVDISQIRDHTEKARFIFYQLKIDRFQHKHTK